MARAPKALRITGRILKYTAILLIVAINVILFWRMFTSGAPDSINTLIVDDALLAAYAEHGEALQMFRQSQDEYTTAERNYAYFGITDFVFIPEASQLQIVFRYNNSTLEAVARDKGLASVPGRDEDIFDVTVVKTVDLTPEDKVDNQLGEGIEKIRISPDEVVSAQKSVHNYRRYVFNNITAEDAEGIFVDIYFKGDVNYDEISYGTLCLYNCEMKNVPVTLNKLSIKALDEALYGEK